MPGELVSVVIPAFNAEAFIGDAIESVFKQDYRPLELVVVNDGSTDGTAEIAKELFRSAADDITVKLVALQENKGAANALWDGFSRAAGEYIAWLSADDLFLRREKISQQVEVMKDNHADWSYFRNYISGPDITRGRVVKVDSLPWQRFFVHKFEHDSDFRLLGLMFQNPVNGSSTMVSRSCIRYFGQFDPKLNNVDADGDLWMRYSALGATPIAIDGAPIFYRTHALQTSQKRLAMLYGMELTRLRMLTALARLGHLGPLVSEFSGVLSIILMQRSVAESSPFTTIFLTEIILNQVDVHNPFLRSAAMLARSRALEFVGSQHLDAANIRAKAASLSCSSTFVDFLERLARREHSKYAAPKRRIATVRISG